MHNSKKSSTFAADLKQRLFKSIFYILSIRFCSQIKTRCKVTKNILNKQIFNN